MLLIDSIDHLSASHINTFITDRPSWFLRYFRGLKFKENYNTLRGKAVEDGIGDYITSDDPNLQKAIEVAVKKWDEGIKWIPSGDNLDYKQSIGPLVKAGIAHLKDFGKPEVQHKITTYLDGCSIPVVGYLDFLYPDKIIDNKVTGKTPKELSQGYVIQGAIYRHVSKLPVSFVFEVALKTPTVVEIPLGEEAFIWGLKYATKAACAIEKILTAPVDGELMEAFMFPNADACWNEDDADELMKAYGI